MRRRGFFGFLAGSAVAGPGMAKAAVAQTVRDLELGPLGLAGGSGGPPPTSAAWDRNDRVRHIDLLGRLTNISPQRRRFDLDRTSVYGLDPDLATYRSMSLGFRIAVQRERNYELGLSQRRGWFEAKISGLLGQDES